MTTLPLDILIFSRCSSPKGDIEEYVKYLLESEYIINDVLKHVLSAEIVISQRQYKKHFKKLEIILSRISHFRFDLSHKMYVAIKSARLTRTDERIKKYLGRLGISLRGKHADEYEELLTYLIKCFNNCSCKNSILCSGDVFNTDVLYVIRGKLLKVEIKEEVIADINDERLRIVKISKE